MADEVLGLSSMATRLLLADLADDISRTHAFTVRFRSAGGVQIAQEVRDGAEADLVVLAEGALARLAADGFLLEPSIRPLFVSEVVAAVPAVRTSPPVDTEDDLRAALLASGRIAYSTGPSGSALVSLIERWGLGAELGDRLVQAPPGVPVGTLLARGEADLGFQQRSELMDVEGVVVLGPLPGEAAIRSVFGGAVLAGSRRPAVAEQVLDLLGSASAAAVVRTRGMSPAAPAGSGHD